MQITEQHILCERNNLAAPNSEEPKKMKYIVRDRLGKMAPRGYYTPYHAEQMARALNMSDATQYLTYYGTRRFSVEQE